MNNSADATAAKDATSQETAILILREICVQLTQMNSCLREIVEASAPAAGAALNSILAKLDKIVALLDGAEKRAQRKDAANRLPLRFGFAPLPHEAPDKHPG